MKNLLLIISLFICHTFAMAQTSQYFDIDTVGSTIGLTPKGLSPIQIQPTPPPHNNQCWIKNDDLFKQKFSQLIQEAFKGIKKDDALLLKKIKFIFTLNKEREIVFYTFQFSQKQMKEIIKLEKEMDQLGQMCLGMNTKEYFRVEDEELFQKIDWCIPLYGLYNYKAPSIIGP